MIQSITIDREHQRVVVREDAGERRIDLGYYLALPAVEAEAEARITRGALEEQIDARVERDIAHAPKDLVLEMRTREYRRSVEGKARNTLISKLRLSVAQERLARVLTACDAVTDLLQGE